MFSLLSLPVLCFHLVAVQIVFNQSDGNLMWHEHDCIISGLFVNAVHRYKSFLFLSIFGHLRQSTRPLGVFDSVFLNVVSQTSLYIETPATSQMRHSVVGRGWEVCQSALPAQFGRCLAHVKLSFLWELKKYIIQWNPNSLHRIQTSDIHSTASLISFYNPGFLFYFTPPLASEHLQCSTVCCHS